MAEPEKTELLEGQTATATSEAELPKDPASSADGSNAPGSMQPDHPGCTLEQYAAAKRLPVEHLKRAELSNFKYREAPAVRIPFFDERGCERTALFRVALTGSDRFRWKSKTKPIQYGLWSLKKARDAGYIVLTHSISDCHTLWSHGIPAIALVANWKEERDAKHLEGIPAVFVGAPPEDAIGAVLAPWIGGSSVRHRVRLISIGQYADINELYLAAPESFRDRWQTAVSAAVPWTAPGAADAPPSPEEFWKTCEQLARAPRLLDRFAGDLATSGVVGEERAAKLIYLVVTTRFLDKPVSAKVAGQSSAGKSHLVQMVLQFFPESAYYALTGMSERTLAYTKEPLSHRILVLYEAEALSGDFASYLIRSLLSEGRLRYETVEKTEDGFQTRLIEREGPTGLLTTTTAVRLHPENETRLITVPVNESADQTRTVMIAAAEERDRQVELTEWHALQGWLQSAEHRVVVPFGVALAEKIPPLAVRLRRDIQAILNLIRAHALLHQATRGRDAKDRVVATLDDYAVVRELVADLVAEGVEATVSNTIRETVAAVEKVAIDSQSGVSVAELAAELDLDKSTTSRRVRAALERGYLKNLEYHEGRPFKLQVGDPLPTEIQLLPTVEELEAYRCSVAAQTEGIDPSLCPGLSEVDDPSREVIEI